MATGTDDFWYRAARHAREDRAREQYAPLLRLAKSSPLSFAVLLFQSDDTFYYTVVSGNFPPHARKAIKTIFRGISVTLSPENLRVVRALLKRHQEGIFLHQSGRTTTDVLARTNKSSDRPRQPGKQNDQDFYEKKERLLRRLHAGIATSAQKDWLAHWGFLESEEPKQAPHPLPPTYPGSPTKTRVAYRYRGPMKATPLPGGGASLPPQKRASKENPRNMQARSQRLRPDSQE